MARFFGEVGYGEPVESSPGVWVDQITEQSYYGDIIRASRSLEDGLGANKDVSVSNSISILADEKAIKDFMKIKYVRWSGVLWTVASVEVQAPRLILALGKVYNGPTP